MRMRAIRAMSGQMQSGQMQSGRRARKGPPRKVAKERAWRETLARWRRSKLGVRAFCAAEGLSEASFYAWRREVAERDGETPRRRPPVLFKETNDAAEPSTTWKGRRTSSRAFVRVEVDSCAAVATAVEIALPSGHVLRVSPGCDRDTLATVVGVLEQRPC